MKLTEDFKEAVYDVVRRIPEGRVMTYGDVAVAAGVPGAAWEVGQIAHWGPEDVPWQRVVNKQGGLARGYTWGGKEGHKQHLEAEGVVVDGKYAVDIESLIWWPYAEN